MFVHSDHCAKKLLPWFDGMLDFDEEPAKGLSEGGMIRLETLIELRLFNSRSSDLRQQHLCQQYPPLLLVWPAWRELLSLRSRL